MDIKEDQQVWCTSFLIKKTGSGANKNEVLAQELHKPVIKKSKEGMPMPGLKVIFGQQIQLKQDLYLLNIEVLNIYYVSLMFSPNILGLNL